MTPAAARRPALAAALAALLAGGACATPPKGAAWSDVRAPEVQLETLPPGAALFVDGVDVGHAPLSYPIRDVARSYAVRVTAPGFVPLDRTVPGSRLAGQRYALVMRPEGFGSERKLEAGEPIGLLQAANVLVRAGRPREALAYAQASVAAGDTAPAHRVLGECYRRLGNRNEAVQEYSLYIVMAPNAPDRGAVEAAIAEARGDIPVTPMRSASP